MRRSLLSLVCVVATMVLLVVANSGALAFKLSPEGTALERVRAKVSAGYWDRMAQYIAERGVFHFTESVHEEITHRIYGCEADKTICGDPDVQDYAPASVLAGVRWNDDPPFRITATSIDECKTDQTIRVITQPVCWYKLFKHAEKIAGTTFLDATNPNSNLMTRSHFGDLQFLHAMASKEAESSTETRANILMWAEFAWGVARGDIASGVFVRDVKIERFDRFFGKSGWRVQDLLALGSPFLQNNIRDVAFGTLLHVVQDSFARRHVDRLEPIVSQKCEAAGNPQPGPIRAFASYPTQDHADHAKFDSRDRMVDGLIAPTNVLSVGRVLREYYRERKPWNEVRPYIECIFAVDPGL